MHQNTDSSSADRWQHLQQLYTNFCTRKKHNTTFSLPPHGGHVTGQVRRRFNLQVPWLMVHAGEPQEAEGQMSTMEKLVQSKPRISFSDAEIQAHMDKETPTDRLRLLFTKLDNGDFHPDMQRVLMDCKLTSATCFLIGCVMGMREAKASFVEDHKATKWQSKFLASRAHNDVVFVGGVKTGLSLGLRAFAFLGILLTTSQMFATYRNKSSVFDYAIGGVVAGSLFRVSLGPRGMFAAGVVAGGLGIVAGVVSYPLRYWAGDLQEDRHYRFVQEQLRKTKEIQSLVSASHEADSLPQADDGKSL